LPAALEVSLDAVVNVRANHERHGVVLPRHEPRVGLTKAVALVIKAVAPADAVFALWTGGSNVSGRARVACASLHLLRASGGHRSKAGALPQALRGVGQCRRH
jgi:hypothetical protein